jgi:8-oxo-dGDP phosphatase
MSEPEGRRAPQASGKQSMTVPEATGSPVFEDVPEEMTVLSSAPLLDRGLISARADKVRFPNDQIAERQVVIHPGAVAILALDDDERVLMIRQYRHPVGRLLWELPAGLRDVAGEPLHVTAERELLEEAGYAAREWHTLIDYFSSPGYSTERLRVYLARGLTPAADPGFVREHEEAFLEVGWLPLDEAVGLALAGKLHNGVTISGVLAGYAARSDGFAALRPAGAPES